MNIPVSQPSLVGNEKKYVLDCIDSNWISSNGKYIHLFEQKFADYLGNQPAFALNGLKPEVQQAKHVHAIRNNETGGRSSVVRLKQGSRFPRHAHMGTEEVLVLEGSVTLDGLAMSPGDYLFTIPGEEHDVVAVTDAVIFVSSQKATPLVQEPR